MALAALPSGKAVARGDNIFRDMRCVHIAFGVARFTSIGGVVRHVTRCTFQLPFVPMVEAESVLRLMRETPSI